jgi:hypothetical protein
MGEDIHNKAKMLYITGTAATTPAVIATEDTSKNQTAINSNNVLTGMTEMYDRLTVEIRNSGASVALNAFTLHGMTDVAGELIELITATSSTGQFITQTTGNAAALGTESSVLVTFDISGLYGIQFKAGTASSTSSVIIRGKFWKA